MPKTMLAPIYDVKALVYRHQQIDRRDTCHSSKIACNGFENPLQAGRVCRLYLCSHGLNGLISAEA
ncbi:hypothetical protein [Variovorax guangxiensis]|uniref:Uncharacterized protein n=1 Tax=Variovorax guangxiensis TaxID=1775474 RepID=A0A840G084_9BURK|nr:hypothetical protein [Variovorax guangxiensis]MBB4225009.1 hypothetical protein [Variovorax guangxiensis]